MAASAAPLLWDECLDKLALEYPEVETDKMHVDAATMAFVGKPEVFDVT